MLPQPIFSKDTGPDALTRAILAKPLRKFDEGTPVGTNPFSTIHKNFPQLIEQNFARRDNLGVATLIDSLREAELSDLAEVYVNATTDLRSQARLLPLLASRLRATQLARLARHFGYSQVAAAVSVGADIKTKAAFAALPHTNYAGPTPGEMRFGITGRFAPARRARMSSTVYHGSLDLMPATYFGPVYTPRLRKVADWTTLSSYTAEEIYLTFRTAPGATAGLFEIVLSSVRYCHLLSSTSFCWSLNRGGRTKGLGQILYNSINCAANWWLGLNTLLTPSLGVEGLPGSSRRAAKVGQPRICARTNEGF